MRLQQRASTALEYGGDPCTLCANVAAVTAQHFAIRRATADDAGELAALSDIPQALHVAAHPELFKVPDRAELEAWYRMMLERPIVHAWVAAVDATPVGYVLAIERETESLPVCFARRWLELDQIGVNASQRRRGIGRALAEEVLDYARAHRFEQVELNTWAFNCEAQRAFEVLGFAPLRLRYGRRP